MTLSLLLEKFDDVLKERNINQIFCMPYEHLEGFYGRVGFKRMIADEAPYFLQERIKEFFRKKSNGKAILMKRVS